QEQRVEVNLLLGARQLLAKAVVEHRNELEAEQRLDAGQDHAAFLEQVPGRGVELDLLAAAGAYRLLDVHATPRATADRCASPCAHRRGRGGCAPAAGRAPCGTPRCRRSRDPGCPSSRSTWR